MAPSPPPRSTGLETIGNCALLEGKPCSLCEQHIALEPEILEAKALISKAEKVLSEVHARQQLIRTRINQAHDKFSRIPTEIMAEIFKATLTREFMPCAEPYVISSPLYLGAVSQRWRNIAWSTPGLWNWIHIFLCLPASQHLEELVKEWLDRSGTLPLTIHISCGKGVADSDNTDIFIPGKDGIFGNFVDHVNACSSRWEDVGFIVPTTIMSFLHPDSCGAPNLKELRVQTTDSSNFNFYLDTLVKPRSIAFGCYPFTWDDLNIDWNNLVDIYLEGFDEEVCVKAIQQMPNLTYCVLFDASHEIELDSDSPFVHQNLQSLDFITDRTGFERESFFDHFTFPSLTQLTITHGRGSHGINYDGVQRSDCFALWESCIKPFLIRSSSQITYLHLQLPFRHLSLIEALGNAESLKTLHLDNCFEHARFDCYSFLVHLSNTYLLYADNKHSSPPAFLPGLESFNYNGSLSVPNGGKPAFTAISDAFGPLSELKNPHRRLLNRILVESSPIQVTKKNLRRLRNLTEAGMTLKLVNSRTRKSMI